MTSILETADSVVIDTCVLADFLFSNRDRHTDALDACRLLPRVGKRALVPAHGFFELVSVAFSERHRRNSPLELGKFTKSLPFELDVVDITLDFIESHLRTGLATAGDDLDSSGGDMIYLTLALMQEVPLLTEDKRLLAKALKLGVSAYTSRDFVNAYIGQQSGA